MHAIYRISTWLTRILAKCLQVAGLHWMWWTLCNAGSVLQCKSCRVLQKAVRAPFEDLIAMSHFDGLVLMPALPRRW